MRTAAHRSAAHDRAKEINDHVADGLRSCYIWLYQGMRWRVLGARVENGRLLVRIFQLGDGWADVPAWTRIDLA